MKQFSRRFLLITLLVMCFQTMLFSEEKVESKSAFELGKEIAQLKFELFKIENRLGEYEDISDFDLSFISAKKERMLRIRDEELLKSVNNNKETALEILNKATEDIMSKAKELKDKGKDFLDYIKKYFE